MGGNISTFREKAVEIPGFISELAEISYEKSIGSSRFLKSVKCFKDEERVLVKVYFKDTVDVSSYVHVLLSIRV
jgi:phosphoinositide-3-kinase regulatory subunit 4